MRFKKNFKSNLIQIINDYNVVNKYDLIWHKSNFIQIINDFNVANKYDLIWQTHFILKCLNQNIINEEIIITLRNLFVSSYVKINKNFACYKCIL
jgi:aspartate carbamoyltransferase regulatory subunit